MKYFVFSPICVLRINLRCLKKFSGHFWRSQETDGYSQKSFQEHAKVFSILYEVLQVTRRIHESQVPRSFYDPAYFEISINFFGLLPFMMKSFLWQPLVSYQEVFRCPKSTWIIQDPFEEKLSELFMIPMQTFKGFPKETGCCHE